MRRISEKKLSTKKNKEKKENGLNKWERNRATDKWMLRVVLLGN